MRIGFVISGPAYAEHVRREAEAALRAQPGAPEGLTVKPMPTLQQLSGRGELWVNAAGLPVRQVVELTMPEVSEGYDAHVRMVTDLSSYGQVEGLPRAIQNPDGTWGLEGNLPPGAGTRLDTFSGFGAGMADVGQNVTHAYGEHGAYTATVTATNSASTVHTTTLVTILALSVNAGEDQIANEGEPITLTATFLDGRSDVTHIAAFDWGDGTSTTGDVDSTALTITGNHAYGDNGVYTVTVTIDDQRGSTAFDSLRVTVGNLPPVVTVEPMTQTVHYSELVAPIVFTATDVASDTLEAILSSSSDGSDFSPGAPGHLSLDEGACSVAEGTQTCAWTLSGAVLEGAGTYELKLSVTDKDGETGERTATLVVVPEETAVDFDSENPVAVQVAAPGGTSPEFTLRACVSERHAASLGDLDLAQVAMSLVPVGPGGSVAGTETVTTTEEGAKCVTFTFSEVPVNTYTVEVTVTGDHYVGSGEDVLVVYDPSLGFTTGGGWFFWPGTDDPETGYRGDRTTFGYTMKYNKAGKNLQGSLLLIRHLEDDSIYRVKSNALDGLALGEDRNVRWVGHPSAASARTRSRDGPSPSATTPSWSTWRIATRRVMAQTGSGSRSRTAWPCLARQPTTRRR